MSLSLAAVLAMSFTGAPLKPIEVNYLLAWQFERKASNPVQCLHESQSQTPVQTAGCTAVGNHQAWQFKWRGNREFEIRNLRTGGCLDVEGASTYRGARVIDWPCHGGANQRWQVLGRSDYAEDHVLLRSVHGGLCAETENGELRMRDCHVEAGGVPVFRMVYHVDRWARQGEGIPMRVVRGGRCAGHDGSRVFLADCGAPNTRFYHYSADQVLGSFHLATSPRFQQCMTVERASDGYDYAVMRACSWSNEDNSPQHWTLEESGNAWQYRNRASGLCLNAQWGQAHAGTRLIAWPCAPASDNARWWYATH